MYLLIPAFKHLHCADTRYNGIPSRLTVISCSQRCSKLWTYISGEPRPIKGFEYRSSPWLLVKLSTRGPSRVFASPQNTRNPTRRASEPRARSLFVSRCEFIS